jgi:hypothetical protein
MNTEDLFEQLEPPPGGAETFARRLDDIAVERPSPRTRALAAAAAIACLAVVTAVLLLRPAEDAPPRVADTPPAVDIYNAPELDRLLGRPSRPADLTVMVDMETAHVTQIETTNEKVRIYQIN